MYSSTELETRPKFELERALMINWQTRAQKFAMIRAAPGGGARGGFISATARDVKWDKSAAARNNNYRRPLIIVALFATHLAARLSRRRLRRRASIIYKGRN
jgi:hypothetical protein